MNSFRAWGSCSDSLILGPNQTVTLDTNMLLGRGRFNEAQILALQEDSVLQNHSRGMIDYLAIESIAAFMKAHIDQPGFHWLDVGGGLGVAGLESFFVPSLNPWELTPYREFPFEHLDKTLNLQKLKVRRRSHQVTVVNAENLLNVMYPIAKTQTESKDRFDRYFALCTKAKRNRYGSMMLSGNYRYLIGRFENFENENLKQSDLITDYFGAFTYSPHKFTVLKKMVQLLKPGGKAIVVMGESVVMFPGGPADLRRVLSHVPGIKIEGEVLEMTPVEDTIRYLEHLEKEFIFEYAEGDSLPPVFYFRVNKN